MCVCDGEATKNKSRILTVKRQTCPCRQYAFCPQQDRGSRPAPPLEAHHHNLSLLFCLLAPCTHSCAKRRTLLLQRPSTRHQRKDKMGAMLSCRHTQIHTHTHTHTKGYGAWRSHLPLLCLVLFCGFHACMIRCGVCLFARFARGAACARQLPLRVRFAKPCSLLCFLRLFVSTCCCCCCCALGHCRFLLRRH